MNAKRNVRKILVFGAIAILLGTTFLPICNSHLLHTETIGKESLMKSDILNDNSSQIGLPIVPIKKRWSRTSGKTLDQKIDRSASDKMSIMDESMNGTTLYVGGSGPGNYTHIQDAINDANDGDTVFVYNGTYYENLVVNKSINLIGEYRYTTVIDGSRSGDVMNITAYQVSISGFTIRNSDKNCAGIDIHSSYNSISNNNILINYFGMFLCSCSSSNSISSNKIISNNVHGIYLYHSSNNSITGNKIIWNHNCDGIFLSSSDNNSITGNIVTSNALGGISLSRSKNNIVLDNNILNNYIGISLANNYNNYVFGNNILNNNRGIWLECYNRNNCIFNNKIKFNSEYGIYISGFGEANNSISYNYISFNSHGIRLWSTSNNNKISSNKISNNKYGMYLRHCSNSSISGNKILNNDNGMYLYDSSNNTILDNSFFNDGLLVRKSYQNTVSNNTVNGKPLIYLEGESDEVIDKAIDDAGQVILVNCENITIQNQELSNTDVGIELWDTNNCLILGNDISGNVVGIELIFSNSNTISGNKILNNKYGIRIEGFWIECTYPNDNNISGNNILNNHYGIYFYHYSNNNSVSSNNILNNHYGIFLSCSYSNVIKYNNFIKNFRHAGFYYERSGYCCYNNPGYFSSNCWNRNYWNRPRILPKPLFGWEYEKPSGKSYLQLEFDWHPLIKPYTE